MKALRSVSWRVAMVAAAFAAGFFVARVALPRWTAYHRRPGPPGSTGQSVCRARVERVVAEREGQLHLEVVVLDGPRRGKRLPATQDISHVGRRGALRKGDRCLVDVGEGARARVAARERDIVLAGLMAALVAVLFATAGRKGLAASCSAAWAMVLVVGLLLPAVRNGARAAPLCVPLAIAVAAPTLVAVGGWNRKSLAAIIGTLCGMAGAWALSAAMARAMALTGLELQFGPHHHLENVLWFAPPLHDVRFDSLLVGAMMLAGLGAVMDVSMAVASTVAEVGRAAGATPRLGLFRAGLGAGRDIIGAMVFTLVMVFAGSHLVSFVSLALTGWAGEWMLLLNYEEVASELARAASAAVGMALCVPSAALAAAFLSRRPDPAGSQRLRAPTHPWRTVVRATLAIGVWVVGAGAADEWTLRTHYGARSRQQAARVVGFSRPVIETSARSADPHDKTCFHSRLVVVQPYFGAHAGELLATRMLLGPNPSHNLVLRRGAAVSICIEEENGKPCDVSLLKLPLRYRWGLVAVVVVAAVVVVVGGSVGLRALAAMALACGLLVGGLIPALARGAPPLAASGVFCGVALLGVFAIAGRVDMKAVSALIGSVVGLGVAGGLLALTRVLGFSGTESVPARFLAWVSGRAGVRYDYLGLATASLLAATLGLVMDIAVTVAAGVAQVGAARPGIGQRESLAAGMNISRDVVGTMVLTLVFAFVGMRLPVLLLPPGLGLSPAEVVNGEAGSLEVLYVLVGSLALATTGPATALAAALLASRVPRRESRRPPRRAPALVLAIAASVWVVAGGLVWWRLRGERLSHAARVALPRDVDRLLQVARRARRQGRFGEALVALWECIERRPGDPRAHVELAYVSMARRWLAHARYHIERALALGADDSFAHYVAGVVYIWTGQKADARRHLMRALELDPDNAPARQALATVLLD